METLHLIAAEPGAIDRAATLLRQGQTVVFPTDTLYGVGVIAFDATAIDRLYAAKERPSEKAIPVLLADVADLERIVSAVPDVATDLIARYWPGPLTLILPKQPTLPANLTAYDSVAVRIPDHGVARRLIRAAGGAVATTSANLSREAPAQTGETALAALRGRVAAVLDDGPAPGGLASTILDCTTTPPRILRAGPITPADLPVATTS